MTKEREMHRKIWGHWAKKMAQYSADLTITRIHIQSPESLFKTNKQTNKSDDMIPTCFLSSGEEGGSMGLTDWPASVAYLMT